MTMTFLENIIASQTSSYKVPSKSKQYLVLPFKLYFYISFKGLLKQAL